MKIKEYLITFFSSKKNTTFFWIFSGIFVGLSLFIVFHSRAFSYLSDNPSACVNCHIMMPYYATWSHSSHAIHTNCNDCHVPHNNTLNKYFFKAKDGLRHATVFTFHNEPQVMQAIDASSEVILNNCIRCHTQLNTEFVKTGTQTYKMIVDNNGKACWDCHRDVPHYGKNSLSSTPNALVPYPKTKMPKWLKTQTLIKK